MICLVKFSFFYEVIYIFYNFFHPPKKNFCQRAFFINLFSQRAGLLKTCNDIALNKVCKFETAHFGQAEGDLLTKGLAKRIWINLELAKKPQECLEYIVAHEMVHLLERRHNGRFMAFMDKFLS